ncbi:MAG: acyl-coenzyme A thioesterase PaaI-like protein [Acidimicrobiales bacterium]|jgi:acyl-coenzyme A thioesterase PaaI-like protein
MATTGAETHNLAAADGSTLIAVAEVIKPGRHLAVARAEVFNNSLDGTRCLTGLFTAVGVAVAPRSTE